MRRMLSALFLSLAIFSIPSTFGTEVKEWNLLVFLNGVNDLDPWGAMNINQMEEVGSSDKMNILVQWGSLAAKKVTRLRIEKDNDTNNVTSPVLQDMGENLDMGDWRELVNFAKWANENYPARKYLVVVWNHGTGWHFYNDLKPMDISYDDRTNNSISTEQLADAMRAIASVIGHKVDIYASDACSMGMIEVAEQMADAVDYFVGSQDLEPGQGWPYAHILRRWQADYTQSNSQVSRIIAEEFLNAYSPDGVYGLDSVTMSVFDISRLAEMNEAIRQLTQSLLSLNPDQLKSLLAAAKVSKQFFPGDYVDFTDFINKALQAVPTLQGVPESLVAQQNFVIANHQNQDATTFGMSIWLPQTAMDYEQFSKRYADLSFNKKTRWGDFLKVLVDSKN